MSEVSRPTVKGSFPLFFQLPREIRDLIYEETLSLPRVTTVHPNPEYEKRQEESEPFAAENPNYRNSAHAPGRLQAQNTRFWRTHLSINLLRVNRQVYKEALLVFEDNVWIAVSSEVVGLGRDLRKRGFGALPIPINKSYFDPARYKIALAVDVACSDPVQATQDVCFIPHTAAKDLCRAVVSLKDQTGLDADLNMRYAPGLRQGVHLDEVCHYLAQRRPRCTGPRENYCRIPSYALSDGEHYYQWIKYLNTIVEFVENEGLESSAEIVAETCEKGLAHVCDIHKNHRQWCQSPVTRRYLVARCIFLGTLLAASRLALQDFQSTIKYTSYVMALDPLADSRKAELLVLRGKAYVGIGKDQDALCDFSEAQAADLDRIKEERATEPEAAESLMELQPKEGGSNPESIKEVVELMKLKQKEKESELESTRELLKLKQRLRIEELEKRLADFHGLTFE